MWRSFSVLCLFSSLTLAVGQTAWQEGFEQAQGGQPIGWSFSATRGAVSGAWDASEPAGGHSIRLEVKEAGGRATWIYGPRLPLKPSTCYRLQFRVMRVNVQARGRAYVILYENGVEAPASWHVSPYLGGTQDWQTCTVTFRTRPDASWGRLQCKLWEAPGYAWFDDLVLEEISPDAISEAAVKQRPTPPDDGSPLQLMWYPAQRRPDNTLHLLPGAVNPAAMFFWGRKDEVKEPVLIVETPPQVTVRGPVVCSRETIPEAVDIKPERATRDGAAALRWRLPIRAEQLTARLKPTGPEWTAYHFIYVQPGAGCPRTFTWRWQTECAGKPGPWHELPAQLEPRAEGKLSRVPSFPLYAQHTDALRLPTRQERQAVLDSLAYAGIEGGLALASHQRECHPIDQELERQGFHTWEWLWDGYSQKGGEGFPLVYEEPKGPSRLMCPQAQAERAEPWWSSLCETYRARIERDTTRLIINFEPPVFNCCFCERCRKAFAAWAKLPPEQVAALSPRQIQELPDDAWGRFRAAQNGQIVKNHCAAIHAANPRVQVGLCGPQYDDWTARRGMDIRQFEPDVAFHAPMIYTVGLAYADPIRSTCENTKAPVIPFVLASDLAVPPVFPTAQELRTNLLVTAASGGAGAVLWVGIESLDGEYLNALRQGLREIALLEPYVQGGTRIEGLKLDTVPERTRTVKVGDQSFEVSPFNTGTSTMRQWAWQSPRGRLYVLVNYDELNARRIETPGAKSLLGPAPTTVAGRSVLTLQPGEAAAVVVK
ncbi:hypothetical protein LLH23_23980 [bacterium]|nr:hypothetical protein [bacterium]